MQGRPPTSLTATWPAQEDGPAIRRRRLLEHEREYLGVLHQEGELAVFAWPALAAEIIAVLPSESVAGGVARERHAVVEAPPGHRLLLGIVNCHLDPAARSTPGVDGSRLPSVSNGRVTSRPMRGSTASIDTMPL